MSFWQKLLLAQWQYKHGILGMFEYLELVDELLEGDGQEIRELERMYKLKGA